ncbi:sugar ABC transporter substrate-binding protein [Paenibacillus alkaliterrae]|uniref:ABC transporter substrate-binding protein n=1 Tax=Paenibacillus alkaliterrae TaxID=320909 RepID=UPI001F31459B|nr:sugar ABC transporter substrate-binding protein [Paenibacillus alkaliterrae]MCF2940851.1 sugar ABC transporter substrate-binding protein [Paenibacillus alkaliterrae]
MNTKKWCTIVMTLVLTFTLAACGGSDGSKNDGGTGTKSTEGESTEPQETVKLKFMFWGSNEEKKAIEGMVNSFNQSHPNIQVSAEHVPGDYNTKINTLMASNELPDVAYLSDSLASKWGSEGKLLDLTPYVEESEELQNRLDASYYYSEPGKVVGYATAAEVMVIYYNKDLFTEAGIELPPAEAEKAWTWDQFLEIAKKLTKDKNGKTAADPDFDPNNIDQYGFSFGADRSTWGPFMASNGAGITDETGMKYTMNSPESVEVFQSLQDLLFKYHVAPDLIQQKNMPDNYVRLQTRKVAMVIDGTWAQLDISKAKLNYGIGVLPKFKEPKTTYIAGASVVFANTKHQKEAMEFYKFHNNPEQVDLYKIGLWMPVETKYYTDQAAIDLWTNDVHPPEWKTAAMDYALNYSIKAPTSSLKNWPELSTKITPALELIWTNKKTAKEVLDELEKEVQPLLQGKYADK